MQFAAVRSCLPFIRSGQNHLASPSERGQKTRQTEEEAGRQHQGMDRPGVQQVLESSGEQGKMEKTGCEIICGAPTTFAVKGFVSSLVLWAQSTTEDYIRAEHKLHPICRLFISQVIIPQVMFLKKYFLAYLYSAGTQHGNPHQTGWPILFCGPTQEPVSQSQHRRKSGEVLEKTQVNGLEG